MTAFACVRVEATPASITGDSFFETGSRLRHCRPPVARRGSGFLIGESVARSVEGSLVTASDVLAERVRGTRAEVDALEREAGWRGRYQPDPDELADLDAGIAALRNWLACPPTGWVGWTGWGVMFAAASGTAGWAWLELGRPFIAAITAVAALMRILLGLFQADDQR